MIDAEAIQKFIDVGAAQAVQTVQLPTGTGVVTPDGYQLSVIADPAKPPAVLRQSVLTRDLDSFVTYFSGFRFSGSVIFANPDDTTIKAVLDYHGPDSPQHCCHAVTYAPKCSDAWIAWRDRNGKPQPQAEFADFLEERAADILSPVAAELVEVAMGLRATKKVDFESGINLSNGAVQFTYAEEVKATTRRGSLDVPSRVTLKLPVFERSERASEIGAWLRYSIADGKLSFTVKLSDPQTVATAAFDGLVADLRARVPDATIIIGRP